jgi:hypothetical protein
LKKNKIKCTQMALKKNETKQAKKRKGKKKKKKA